jgi:hypothetical protein
MLDKKHEESLAIWREYPYLILIVIFLLGLITGIILATA